MESHEQGEGRIWSLLQKHQLEQREQFERLLLSHEQRLLDSISSCVGARCRDACEEALKQDTSASQRGITVRDGSKERCKVQDMTPMAFHAGPVAVAGFQKPGVVDEDKIREVLVGGPMIRSSATSVGFSRGLRDRVRRVIYTRFFDNFMIAIITLNAFVIGIEVDWAVKHTGQGLSLPLGFRIAEVFFAALFTLELAARVIADGCRFVSPRNQRIWWNMLDVVLVFTVLFDEVSKLLRLDALDVSSAKLVRLLRLARIVRVLRLVREFHDLEIMVLGILGSLKSLVWAMVLLSMIVFMFAAVFMEFVANELSDGRSMAAIASSRVVELYGSLVLSIYTLFKSVTGGIDWDTAAAPLIRISPVLGVLFALYIGFAFFCVLNIITAVFVENARHIAERDEEKLVLQVLERRCQKKEDVAQLFRCVNREHNGELSIDEFKSHLADLPVQGCFARLGIDIDDQSTLFEWVDLDGNGRISVQEFTQCVSMLQTSASRADVDRLLRESVQLQKQLQDILEACRDATELGFLQQQGKATARLPSSLQAVHSQCPAALVLCPAEVLPKSHDAPRLSTSARSTTKVSDVNKAVAIEATASVAATSAAEAALRAAATEAEVDPSEDSGSTCSGVLKIPLPSALLPGTIDDAPLLS